MSPSATIGIITKLSSQYDGKVFHWASELKKVCMYICIYIYIYIYINLLANLYHKHVNFVLEGKDNGVITEYWI